MRIYLAIGLIASGCSSYEEPPEVKSDLARIEAPSTEHLPELVAGTTAFAADLYRAASAAGGNVLVSPHSITTALAMTYAGAGGTTATQMATALHIALPADEFHEAMNALDLALDSRADGAESSDIPFRLDAANSLFAHNTVAIQPAFLDRLALDYGSGVHVVDMDGDAEGSIDLINGWVEHHTNGKIQDLLPGNAFDQTRAVLVNALYFAAAWDVKFEGTHDAPFEGVGMVTMMQGTFPCGFGQGERFRAVELNYDGDQLALIVVVPELLDGETGDPLALLEANLTGDKLAEIEAAVATEQDLQVALPRFKFTKDLRLDEALQSFGMTDAFSTSLADFSGMFAAERFWIQRVLHKAYIDVNERGTEAAAATTVIIGDDSGEPQFTVDRPFLFLLRDKPTGEILFIGRVVDPTAS